MHSLEKNQMGIQTTLKIGCLIHLDAKKCGPFFKRSFARATSIRGTEALEGHGTAQGVLLTQVVQSLLAHSGHSRILESRVELPDAFGVS